MKNIFSLIATCTFISLTINVSGQQDRKITEQIIKTANAQKTGNWQDVFTSFFQLAAKDIAGNNRSFDFKSTLFAMRLKLDPTLNVDTNYVDRAFDRNFQFNTSLKLDSQYNFKSFGVGFTWAIINKRDSTILSFIGQEEDLKFKVYSDLISDALNIYRQSVSIEKYNSVQKLVQQMVSAGKFELDKLPDDFRRIADRDIEINFNAVKQAIDERLAEIRVKPLLTISINSAFRNAAGVFNGSDAELVYLQGLTKKKNPLELDLRLNYKTTDTTINNRRYRHEAGFVGGMNIGLIISRGNLAPLIELKPHVEFKRVFRGLIGDEKENTFSANATARVRLSRNLWIPFTIKYDLQNHNFLGFLNVSLNWDAFKKQ